MKPSPTCLALALLVLCCCASAQQKQPASNKLQYECINTVGLIDGGSGAALQALTVNGVRYKTWFAGIGTGIDNYLRRSIPVFAEARKTLGNRFFLYADGGANWYWHQDKDVKQFYYNDKFKAAFYGEAGMGYTVNLHRKLALLFCGAYSFKKLVEEGYNYYDIGFPGPEHVPNEKINYHLNRLVLKAGIAF